MAIAYLRLGDRVLELAHHSVGSMSGLHFCPETDTVDESVAELPRNGVEMLRSPHDTAAREAKEKNWRRVIFRGPDGEQVELRG